MIKMNIFALQIGGTAWRSFMKCGDFEKINPVGGFYFDQLVFLFYKHGEFDNLPKQTFSGILDPNFKMFIKRVRVF